MMNKIFIGLLLCPAVYLHGAEPADSTLRLMEEITVAANRQQDVKMNVPQQVYILSRAQIERANAQTAADLLTTDGLLTVQKSHNSPQGIRTVADRRRTVKHFHTFQYGRVHGYDIL